MTHIATVAGTAVAIRTVMDVLAYRVRSPELQEKGLPDA